MKTDKINRSIRPIIRRVMSILNHQQDWNVRSGKWSIQSWWKFMMNSFVDHRSVLVKNPPPPTNSTDVNIDSEDEHEQQNKRRRTTSYQESQPASKPASPAGSPSVSSETCNTPKSQNGYQPRQTFNESSLFNIDRNSSVFSSASRFFPSNVQVCLNDYELVPFKSWSIWLFRRVMAISSNLKLKKFLVTFWLILLLIGLKNNNRMFHQACQH